MIAPVLAGLGALALMSNPPRRRRRRTRSNPGGGWWGAYKERSGAWSVQRNERHGDILQAERDGWQIVFGDTQEKALKALEREARLRGIELAQRTNPARHVGPMPVPTTTKQAYNQGYAEGRDATGELERRGGWPTPTDLDTRRAPTALTIAWRKGYNAGRKAQPQRNPVNKTQLRSLLKAATGVLYARRGTNVKREQAAYDKLGDLLQKYGLAVDPAEVIEQARQHLSKTSPAAIMGGIVGRSRG